MQGQKLWPKILVLKTIWPYVQLERAAFQLTQYPKLLNISKYITLDKNTLRQRLGQQPLRTYMFYQKISTHHQTHTNVQYV